MKIKNKIYNVCLARLPRDEEDRIPESPGGFQVWFLKPLPKPKPWPKKVSGPTKERVRLVLRRRP